MSPKMALELIILNKIMDQNELDELINDLEGIVNDK